LTLRIDFEEKIEVARQEGATELDLSQMGLTELPDAIASLTELQWLFLDNNQFNARPPKSPNFGGL
jgi:Leucine-rich repeat (LRR) protein